MRRGLLLQHVVAVVGHQRRQLEPAADLQQVVAHPLFDLQAVVHQLQEEVVLAVDVLPHSGGFQGLVELSQAQAGLHVAGGAAGGGDDALGVLGDQFGIHAGPLAQLAFVAGHGRQVEQIAQAGRVLRDHRLVQVGTGGRHVVGLLLWLAPAHALLVKAGFRGDVGLDADDGLHASVGHRPIEGVRAVHVSVVGHSDGGHPLPHHLFGQEVDLGHAVEHGVLGVVMQVDKGGTAHDWPS